jgi:hypothetical protein
MADDVDSFDVGGIQDTSYIKGLGETPHDHGGKGRHRQEQEQKEPRDYVRTIVRAAEASNEKLVRANLPYRFFVYTEGEEVFINLVVLDQNGKVMSEKKKNISHQDFARIIEDLSQIEGMFIDKTA